MKVVVGSTSERKVKVVERLFKNKVIEELEVVGHGSKSGVPETPYDKQTHEGAKNRAVECQALLGADYYVGMESGLVERYGQFYEEAWVCVITKEGKEFYGYSSGLKLPDLILNRMAKLKLEHCEVMALIEKEFNKSPNDTWGTYSGGVILREVGLEEALRNALTQALPHKDSLYIK